MDIFANSDAIFTDVALDAGKLEETLGKARVNRLITLPASLLLFIAFLIMAITDTPRAEIIGVIAVLNFALFLKSDSDVKLLSVLQRLKAGKADGGEKAKDAEPRKPVK